MTTRLPLHAPPAEDAATREYTDLVPFTTFDKKRDTPFSYDCKACKRCCHAKVIRVSPYEVLRLSRQVGLSTTDFLAEHTEAGGTVLRTRADTSCVFLSEEGCSVHPDRPLACRIYPLSWFIDSDGEETFGTLEGHPESEGVFAQEGTVNDYCEQQKLQPYLDVARRYIAAHDRLLRVLEAQAESAANAEVETAPAEEILATRTEVDHLGAGALASPWLDVDAVVRVHCEKNGLAVPTAIESIVELHLAALDAWCESIRAENALA